MPRLPAGLRRAVLLCVLLCASSSSADQPRPLLFSVGRFTAAWAVKPRSYDQQLWDHLVAIGATLNGTGLAWCDGEPTQGQYNWDAIDYTDFNVNEMRARGLEPTMFLGLSPKWAALYPDLDPHRTPPAEQYVQQFMDFHRFVAARYKGRVKYYYFWNEPNGCSWINSGCGNSDSYPLYTKWLIRCSQAVKEVDPDAKIIAANIDYHSGVTHGYQYIQGMYNEGAGPYFDIISIHPYDWSGTIHWRAVTDTRNVMVANGDAHKPIWISEYGWNTTDYQQTADKLVQVLTELKKPEWSFVEMASYLVLNDGAGVENYGLMSANLSPRAGYYAFRDFDKTFPQAVDFSASATVGAAPLAVQFTDLSNVYGATAWLWDFGDGVTSTLQNPAHTYTAEGTYTVRLTVTGPTGPLTVEKLGLIRVGRFPKAAFLGQVPLNSADTSIVEHLRGMGLAVDVYDDDPANRPTAAQIAAGHQLVIASSTVLSANVAGEFRYEAVPYIYWESSLSWNGREGLAGANNVTGGQTQINVVNNTHPVMAGIPAGVVTLTTSGADFSWVSDPIATGATVLATLAGDATRRTIVVAEPGAALLDGGTAAGKRAFLYLYDTTWSYANATGRQIFDNTVAWSLSDLAADFESAPASGVAPVTIQFTDRSTGPVTGWTWDFGDGTTSNMRHPSHTYQQPGTYDVSLTVTGPGRSDTRLKAGCVNAVQNVRGDFDHDSDVDLEDFGYLQACLSGPGVSQLEPACAAARLDGDTDVDQEDMALFRYCFSGPGQPLPEGCI